MKISIDLDGTLYFKPEFFHMFISAMQRNGHRVVILTGHSADSETHDREKLAKMGIFPDFYHGRTIEYMPFNGAKFKCDTIRKYGIDIHFDDMDYDNEETIKIFNAPENADVLAKIFKINCAR